VRVRQVIWDLDDDPDGNVAHISEHGISMDEVEEVLYATEEVFASDSSGRPITFGETTPVNTSLSCLMWLKRTLSRSIP
jgi:hypothetical protein